MDKEKVFSLLRNLENGNILRLDNTDGEDFINTVKVCLNKELIKIVGIGNSYGLDQKGYDLLAGKIMWNDLLSKEDKAIMLFESQKSKINNDTINSDEFWRSSTLELIKKYIGVNTQAYIYISGHSFKPNGSETVTGQIERGKKMIEYCIDQIETNGIIEENKDNLYHAPITNITVHGNVHNSDFSQDNSLNKQIKNKTAPNTISKKPLMEKVYWLSGIAVAIIALLTGLKSCGLIN